MKLLLLLTFGLAIIPTISSTENDASNIVEASTADLTTPSPVGEINLTTEEAKNETEKGNQKRHSKR